jgi:phosphinothricin acetyltransferase
MSTLRIRDAAASDLDAVVGIYNHFVERSHVTFDVEPRSPQQGRCWFETFATTGPHRLLVAERCGEIAGWAASSPLRDRVAYVRSVEPTVYVRPGMEGRGIGTALYGALFSVLAEEPVHRAFAALALPNPASAALHASFGFREVGRFGEVGFKHGRYWDVAWYQRDC